MKFIGLAAAALLALAAYATATTSTQNIAISVFPAMNFTPFTLSFPAQTVGTTSTAQTVTAKNAGAITVNFTIGFTGAYAADFSETDNCSGSLAAGASCTISVTFKPSAATTESVSLAVNVTGGHAYTAAVAGTGTNGSLAPGFYVATNGSDSNPGTVSQPFATIARCQAAMRNSAGIKACYLRAGTYNMAGIASDCDGTSAFQLSAADTAETWSYYPPDGPGSAILDGGSTSPTTGVRTGICVNGTSGATINGLQIQRFIHTLIQIYDPNVVAENNTLHDYTEHSNNGAINVGGGAATNVHLLNNYIYNAPERGISAGPCFSSSCAGGINSLTIAGNYIYNTCTQVSDCGAIYIIDFQSPRSTGIAISNNYVRDVKASGGGRGIYLDDGASNVASSGNIIIGAATTCYNIHGGSNDSYTGNICDEDSQSTVTILLYQNSDSTSGGNNGSGNIFTNNVIISGQSGGGGYDGDASPGTPPTIGNNFYHNYVGASINSGGVFTDPNPTTGDPQISCWSYNIAGGSPVFNAVNFSGITGGWGPPGFGIPQSGTPPSSPHAC